MHPPIGRQQPGVSNRGQKAGDMVRLDQKLLFEARSLCNGENGNRLQELISAYEKAVNLHNRNCPRHEVYQMQSESRLRRYVRNSQGADIHGKTLIAKNLARNAAIKSTELTEKYDQLEKLLAQWDRGNRSHVRVPRGSN
ncbi:MAG TPA: hypothetical protein VKK06_08570 [Terriglobia bacterium]|nr:hypothetical protein [Terriglobia bacterium]